MLAVISAVSCVSATDNVDSSEITGDLSDVYVSPDASDETGNGSLQNPFKTINYAISAGKDNSTIYLNDGEYVGDANRNITIDKSVTII